MKLLPTKAMQARNHNFAHREMDLLQHLRHPSIVTMHDGLNPSGHHDTPWTVGEYCKCGNLKGLIRYNLARNAWLDKPLLWHIFESLARAVEPCYRGPSSTRQDRDPVAHRDIILGNVFLQRSNNGPFPYFVKVGDFGCATGRSELLGENMHIGDQAPEDGY
jgi:serine/threonine protein kinase